MWIMMPGKKGSGSWQVGFFKPEAAYGGLTKYGFFVVYVIDANDTELANKAGAGRLVNWLNGGSKP